MRLVTLILLALVSSNFSFHSYSQRQTTEAQKQEEIEDYFKKWLGEDAVYIISDEERAVFKTLSTPDEMEQFIEQFWFRRDPDPRTAENEFKAEHYRRIAYTNEHFKSGREGWRSDRGRVYIIHGPPAEISSFPSGGMYQRPLNEGGGITATYPFEVWRYRNIDGIGETILLEFVDPSLSGDYRLALYPEEKDALHNTPGAGPTLAEQLGLATKADRPWFNPGGREEYPAMMLTARDNPFYRYETYSMVKAPQAIKYDDLKELVSVNVNYSNLPFEIHENYFRLNQDQLMIPINVQLKNQDLTFRAEGELYVARVAVFGIVTTIGKRLAAEFEDDLVMTFSPDQLSQGLLTDSIYQKVLVLDRKQKYKLDLVVRDQASEKLGTVRMAIIPPSHADNTLFSSSVIFSHSVTVLESIPDQDEMFVLGDVKIIPNLRRKFPVDMPVGMYFQVYNAQVDQTTLSPSLRLAFRIFKDGRQVRETVDADGESIQYSSEKRIVIIERLNLEDLAPGIYKIKVDVEDQLSGTSFALEESFELINQPKP